MESSLQNRARNTSGLTIRLVVNIPRVKPDYLNHLILDSKLKTWLLLINSHCTGKLYVHNYGKYSGSKFNQEVGL